jgi:hypothetical protein
MRVRHALANEFDRQRAICAIAEAQGAGDTPLRGAKLS